MSGTGRIVPLMSERQERVVRGLQDAARVVGVSVPTLRKEILAGAGPAHRKTDGGLYLFTHRALISWLEGREADCGERSA